MSLKFYLQASCIRSKGTTVPSDIGQWTKCSKIETVILYFHVIDANGSEKHSVVVLQTNCKIQPLMAPSTINTNLTMNLAISKSIQANSPYLKVLEDGIQIVYTYVQWSILCKQSLYYLYKDKVINLIRLTRLQYMMINKILKLIIDRGYDILRTILILIMA